MNPKKTITVNTTIKAPVAKVWEEYTNPESIKQWNNASADWWTTKAINNLRVGGKFSSRMEAKDGSQGFDFAGIYDQVIKNRLISYTMLDDRKARITFSGDMDETKVEIKFEMEAENSKEVQKSGWQAILDNFKQYVESL